jgi:hypothetical protein
VSTPEGSEATEGVYRGRQAERLSSEARKIRAKRESVYCAAGYESEELFHSSRARRRPHERLAFGFAEACRRAAENQSSESEISFRERRMPLEPLSSGFAEAAVGRPSIRSCPTTNPRATQGAPY